MWQRVGRDHFSLFSSGALREASRRQAQNRRGISCPSSWHGALIADLSVMGLQRGMK